jgi:hypothetical protein
VIFEERAQAVLYFSAPVPEGVNESSEKSERRTTRGRKSPFIIFVEQSKFTRRIYANHF